MSLERGVELEREQEEQHLIDGEGSNPGVRQWPLKRVCYVVFPVLALGVAAIAIAAIAGAFDGNATPPLSVIFMLSDGYGPSAATMARNFVDPNSPLPLDKILVGASITHASDNLVTDSAAGATCYSCGIKTYNGAIAVGDDRLPCATVMEYAKTQGYKTGIVATSRVTHASPAAFTAHVIERNYEDLIAEHQLMQDLDLVLGGGARHFRADGRDDSKDLLEQARQQGYHVMTSTAEFRAGSFNTPVIGLFSDSHMRYEIDRRFTNDQPSLKEMAAAALERLSSHEDEPFFLFIEGSRIDHAGHANDVAAEMHDVIEYQDTVESVLAFIDEHPNTLMVSVSDHETGGLSIGRDGTYGFHPDVVHAVRNSLEFTAEVLAEDRDITTEEAVEHHLGIVDLTPEEIAYIDRERDLIYNNFTNGTLTGALGAPVSVRALSGWTTSGHTGVDVGLYAYGPADAVAEFRAVLQNDEVGRRLERVLSFNLDALTPIIRAKFGDNTSPPDRAAGGGALDTLRRARDWAWGAFAH